jgi:two-component system sensor histidine kinase KdpD
MSGDHRDGATGDGPHARGRLTGRRLPVLATSARPARSGIATALEVVAAVGVATGVVGLLQSRAPIAGLEVVYLPAVLLVAIRRGGAPALLTALLSVLTLNFLFIPPRHQLTIAHSQDVVVLVVLMIAAAVVSRLAAMARQRAGEAESRARLAAAREREASLLAEVASAILAGSSVQAQLDGMGPRIAHALGASRARVALESVPAPVDGEIAHPLRTRSRRAWLYVSSDGDWAQEDPDRLAEPLGRLIDVAVERARVSEQAAEAEASRRAETTRTAILRAISHDLRSPLTAISTAGSALRADVTAGEHGELLDVIEVEGRRLSKLVDDLLDLSKIEAGAVAPRTDWCDLGDVVASAVAHLRTDHPVELALPADLPLVRADAAQLERVFGNLLENAVKFSPLGLPVRVTGGAGAGRVTVRVIDRGEGIAPADRGRIFEPFFRGRSEEPAGGATPGSGLGLAICRGFVEANGGTIVLASSRERGTAFAVTFPAVPAPIPSPEGVRLLKPGG